MGLDMYLTARKWIANYEHDPEGQVLAAAILTAMGIKNQDRFANGGINVELPAAYWRKANAIHGWFVDNVQDGDDNCEEHYVSREKLAELRDLCRSVLDGSRDKDALAPRGGFFFGSTEDDEWYRADLEQTAAVLDALLADDELQGFDFYYRSSW